MKFTSALIAMLQQPNSAIRLCARYFDSIDYASFSTRGNSILPKITCSFFTFKGETIRHARPLCKEIIISDMSFARSDRCSIGYILRL